MGKKQTVTAADIARECGVSQATVSYVISNKPGKRISEHTRSLILEAAARLGYVPSATARSMRTSRAMSIGVAAGGNQLHIGFNQALRGVRSTLEPAGYSITLLSGDLQELLSCYAAGRIDGILFLFFDLPEQDAALLNQRQIPFLLLDDNGVQGLGQEPCRAFEEAVRACAGFCRERDFRDIRFFSLKYGETLYSYKYDLFAGALDALFPQASLRRIIIQTRADPAGGELTNEDLLERLQGYLQEPFTLAVTPNQRLGWLLQSGILREDFRLPQRIRHICLASSPVFHLAYPTVTSIHVPLVEMGAFAAAQLVRLLNGEEPEEQHFSCVLREGLSTQ